MRPSRSLWLGIGLLWLALLAGGWFVLLRHEQTPGFAGRVPPLWPVESSLRLHGEQPTLVIFAHRNCPCTRSSLGELRHLLDRCGERVAVRVVLIAPAAGSSDRVGREIEKRARSLPNTEVLVDPKGIEARRFGVRTSGQVLLYGVDGRLRFSGGITDGRGHAGDSEGQRALRAWLQDGVAERDTAPVYGCLLFDNKDEAEVKTN